MHHSVSSNMARLKIPKSPINGCFNGKNLGNCGIIWVHPLFEMEVFLGNSTVYKGFSIAIIRPYFVGRSFAGVAWCGSRLELYEGLVPKIPLSNKTNNKLVEIYSGETLKWPS